MKKSLMFVASAIAAVVMTGCFSVHTNDATAAVKFDVEAPDMVADVQVGKQAVSGEATVHNVLGIISWGVSSFADDAFVSTSGLPFQLIVPADMVAKQGATYNACSASKSDVILGAKYQLDIADYFVYKTIKCKVVGYPGTIKGVKAK